MFEACTCGTGGKNTGQPSCVPQIERTAKLILVRTFANDGTRNSIQKSDFVNGVLPDTFVESKINEADASKRWYVTPKINAVTDTRAEPITFDVDGIPKIIDQGVRTFLGSFYDKLGSPTFAGVLNSFQCQDMAYYEISVNGDIVGIDNGDEMLPIAIETGTLFSGVVRGTKTELNSVSLTFAVNELVRDENLIQIGAAALESTMLNKRGLITVVGEALSSPVITDTTVRLDMNFIYGSFNNAVPFEGLTATDLSYDAGTTPATVFNVDQSLSVAVSSVTPVLGEAGQYDVVIASGGLSTETISVALSKAGFEMSAFTYVIP
jgi:hypothetical protein